MTEERPDFFPCYQSKLLGALAAMPSDAGYVYTIYLLRQYELGGPVPDSADAIARRCGGMKRPRVVAALEWLVSEGKLVREEAGLSNPIATAVISDRERRKSEARQQGIDGAKTRWEKTKPIQSTEDAPPIRPPTTLSKEGSMEFDLGEEVRTNLPSRRARAPARQNRSRFPEGWVCDAAVVEAASAIGLDPRGVAAVFAHFRDHHVSRGNTFLDWMAAWRTWCRNEVKYSAQRNPPRPQGGGARMNGDGAQRLVDIATGRRDDERRH